MKNPLNTQVGGTHYKDCVMQPVRKIRYRDRLRAHPGKGVATLLTLGGGLAGASNESAPPLLGFIAGALFMGVIVWCIVLWAARTQPVREDEP